MPQLSDYVNRIPGYNRRQPKFIAWLSTCVTPFLQLANLANSLPTLFDVDVAVGEQLDYVGLWVGISRVIEVPLTGVFFTYDTPGLGFNQGVYIGPGEEDYSLSILDDSTYRFLIYAKIAVNHWDGSLGKAEAAYAIAFQQFPGVTVQVIDNTNMTATVKIVNSGLLTAVQQAIITGGYLPLKPLNVAITYVLA
jgi:hypothetical protein